jgi:V/A-type H+-transporting ATPase subunit C
VRVTGYDYGNARLRARRADLLRREQYAALAGRDLPGLAAALAATGYRAQAEDAASIGPPRLVERLVRAQLATALGDVAGFYRDRAAAVVAAIFGRFDVHNALALLRAAHQGGAAGPDGAALIPAGRLDARTAREAASQPELPATARLLASRRLPDPDSAAALLAAARHYELDTSLAAVEHAVARAGRAHQIHVLSAAGPAAEPVTAVLRRETDDQNLLLALRLREAGQPPAAANGPGPASRPFLPGGTVPDGQFAAIQGAPARADLLAVATTGPAAARWGSALTAWADDGDLAALQARLDSERLRADLRLLRGADPLGPAAVLYHVLAHQAQARNIRLLAQAAAGTISHDAARQQVIEPV